MDRREALETLFVFGGGLAFGVVPTYAWAKTMVYDDGYDAGRHEEWERNRDSIGPTTSDEEIHSFNDHATIESGSHFDIPMNLNRETLVSYAVTAGDGDHLDILLMERGEYETYTDGGSPEYLVMSSALDTTRSITKETLPEGEYNFVLDNTDKGHSTASGEVYVGYAVSTYQDLDADSGSGS